MGARRHLPPLEMLLSVFVHCTKRAVDELFMHYFHNLLSAFGASSLTPTGAPSLAPAGDFRLQTPNLPTPGKMLRAPMSDLNRGMGVVIKADKDWRGDERSQVAMHRNCHIF